MTTPRLAQAQETRNAFVWLEFEMPTGGDFSGFSLNSVVDVNNQGRILGQVASGGSTRGFVIANNQWVMLTPNSSTSVRDMNNGGSVVGWTVNPITGRGWVPEYSTAGTDIGSNIQVEGINDSNDYVGYDTNQQTPVGFLESTQGWTALPPLIGGTATAAHGIRNGDQSNYPFIVGVSIGGLPYEDRPVLWTYDGQDFLAHSLDPSNADASDVPYFVNNNGWIVGSTDSGTTPPYEYLFWMPDGNGGWDRNDIGLAGTGAKGIGLNAENEIVAGHYLFVDDGNGGVDQFDLFDMAAIPVQGEATYYYPPANANFRAINMLAARINPPQSNLSATSAISAVSSSAFPLNPNASLRVLRASA